ncbi:MAG: class I adenylate-forming enzyme family protein [Candidatus Nezhaarchaeales archaeon]
MPNFTTFLDVNVHYYGPKPALIFPAKRQVFTYRDLLEAVNRVSSSLKRLGVSRGDRVCVYTGSRPETLISYFSVWRIGAVAVPANPAFKQEEMLHILNDSEASCIITVEQAYRDVVSKIRDRVPSLKRFVVLEGRIDDALSWQDLLEGGEAKFRAENVSLEDLCQIQYTAGTTGFPKGAMLTHGNWMAATEAERWVLDLSDKDVYLGFYPHFHVGVSWGITAVKYGATFVIQERFELNEYLRLAREYEATVLSGMPPVLHALVNAPPGAEEYLKTAKRIITGGAPTPQEVWERFVRRYPHIEVVNAYGLSETIVVGAAPAVPYRFSHMSRGYRSVGAPVGYCEVKIVDENDPSRELPPGEIGEIALRGPGVAKGYWKRPKETQEAFLPDGWFLTGDMGYLDEDGVLYITGRKKDMIIMSGWKIYPAEVENVLVKHPKVSEAAVFAKYDEVRGEVPAAAVVLKPGEKATEEEIIEFCKERLASYKVPRVVIFVNELPKMAGWKVLHRVLREKYGGFPKGK